MINEQRWKTNYVGRSEAGNCFYENVNCVCQAEADTREREGGREVGVRGRSQAQAAKKKKEKKNGEAVDWTSTAPLTTVIGAAFSAAAFSFWTPDVL